MQQNNVIQNIAEIFFASIMATLMSYNRKSQFCRSNQGGPTTLFVIGFLQLSREVNQHDWNAIFDKLYVIIECQSLRLGIGNANQNILMIALLRIFSVKQWLRIIHKCAYDFMTTTHSAFYRYFAIALCEYNIVLILWVANLISSMFDIYFFEYMHFTNVEPKGGAQKTPYISKGYFHYVPNSELLTHRETQVQPAVQPIRMFALTVVLLRMC